MLSLTCQCSGFQKFTSLKTKTRKCWTISSNIEVPVIAMKGFILWRVELISFVDTFILILVLLQDSTSHYNAGTWGIVQGQLRPLLAPRVYTLPMVRSIGKTMVQGKNYGPQITVKRISTRSVLLSQALDYTSCEYWSSCISFCFGILSSLCRTALLIKLTIISSLYIIMSYTYGCVSFPRRGRKCKPIFVQIARQVVKLNASDLRLPSRAWKVKLVGEGADDAGGVFDDTITEMCQVRLWVFWKHVTGMYHSPVAGKNHYTVT